MNKLILLLTITSCGSSKNVKAEQEYKYKEDFEKEIQPLIEDKLTSETLEKIKQKVVDSLVYLSKALEETKLTSDEKRKAMKDFFFEKKSIITTEMQIKVDIKSEITKEEIEAMEEKLNVLKENKELHAFMKENEEEISTLLSKDSKFKSFTEQNNQRANSLREANSLKYKEDFEKEIQPFIEDRLTPETVEKVKYKVIEFLIELSEYLDRKELIGNEKEEFIRYFLLNKKMIIIGKLQIELDMKSEITKEEFNIMERKLSIVKENRGLNSSFYKNKEEISTLLSEDSRFKSFIKRRNMSYLM